MTKIFALNSHRTDLVDCRANAPTSTELVQPLAVIRLSLRSREAAKAIFPNYRFSRLVASRLELDDVDMASFSEVLDLDLAYPSMEQRRPFDHQLRHIIAHYGLHTLFSDDGPGPYHHAIRPTGYDFVAETVIPGAMEQWRADYRSMRDHRQILAASIIWLYRGGKDRCWLRRVPCTWHAADALQNLRAVGALADWAWLVRLYPGW